MKMITFAHGKRLHNMAGLSPFRLFAFSRFDENTTISRFHFFTISRFHDFTFYENTTISHFHIFTFSHFHVFTFLRKHHDFTFSHFHIFTSVSPQIKASPRYHNGARHIRQKSYNRLRKTNNINNTMRKTITI